MPSTGQLPPHLEGAEIEYYDNYIYLAAGQATSSPNMYPGDFFRYNLLAKTWENITNPSSSYISRYFTGSALINCYFYLLPGWNSYLAADVQNYMRVDLDSSDFAWEDFPSPNPYFVDSFDIGVSASALYIFGGYDADTSEYINSLVKLDTSSGLFTVLSANYQSPTARSSHCMHLIDGSLYVFGGISGSVFLNDMWIFSIPGASWSIADAIGAIPSARSDFASDSEGEAIVVWGGRDNTGLLNDMFIFNALTLQWTQVISTSRTQPGPAAGACLVLHMPSVYIYGGITNFGFSGAIWVYDLGSNTYTHLSEDTQLAYASCQILEDYFYVMFGYTHGEKPVSLVRKFNLVSYVWETFYSPSASSTDVATSQGIQLLINSTVLRIAGQAWGFDPHTQVVVFAGNASYRVGAIAEASYSQGSAYYNTSLYIFGGASSISSLLRVDVAHNRLFTINVQEICQGGTCEALCSEGTYLTPYGCEMCRPGYFAEDIANSQCSACSPGTYNANTGATSKRECSPCPQGYYNSEEGAARCLQCEYGHLCPIGSVHSGNTFFNTLQSSVQPQLYSPDYVGVSLSMILVYFGLAYVAGMLVMLSSRSLRGKLESFDIFQVELKVNDRGKIESTSTALGGVSSLIFLFLALSLLASTLFTYEVNNISETKSLVPLVALQDQVADFVADILTVNISILRYGDTCTANGACSPSLLILISNIRSGESSWVCETASDNSCNIYFAFNRCIIDTGAMISVMLNQQLSYASGINVNVTSDSSILGQPSSILSMLTSDSNHIFLGTSESVFYFAMTPSLFTSESSAWPAQATGYHISSETGPAAGSQYLNLDLPTVSQLKLSVNLDKSNYSLYTNRTVKQTWLLFISGIIGSIFGIKAAVEGAMILSGSAADKVMERTRRAKAFKKIKGNRELITDFMDESAGLKKIFAKMLTSTTTSFNSTRKLMKVYPIEEESLQREEACFSIPQI